MNTTRWLLLMALCAGLAGAPACTSKKAGAGKSAPSGKNVIVTPAAGVHGQVASVNLANQYVVLTFPDGMLPVPEQKLNVYRGSLKVGEVRVSREQMGQNLVADLVLGEARVGDEARPE
jgi:hypothetical protein